MAVRLPSLILAFLTASLASVFVIRWRRPVVPPVSTGTDQDAAPIPMALAKDTVRIRSGDLLFVHLPLNLSSPLDRAIQAVGIGTIDWLKEHGVAVQNWDTVVHVALAVTTSSDIDDLATHVVEAVGSGVRAVALHEFLGNYGLGVQFFHGRVPNLSVSQANAAAQYALKQVGLGYAFDFAPPTSVPKRFYCSSLVDYAYRAAMQKDTVFTSESFPLVFLPKAFWEQYYRAQNMSIPHQNGSNPTLLLHSDKLHYSRWVPRLTPGLVM